MHRGFCRQRTDRRCPERKYQALVRAIATRYEKRAINFLAGIYLASIVIWPNRGQALIKRKAAPTYRVSRSN
jgi:transposase